MLSDDSNALSAESSTGQNGLTSEEQAAFFKAIEAVKQRGTSYLKDCRNAEDALKLVGNLHRAIDTVYQQGEQGTYKPDCKAGCSHCCHLRVEILDAEALQIAEEVRRRPPSELVTLIKRLQAQAAMRHAEPSMARTASGCAFLDDGLCSIYSVRPATCRKGHSLSVRQCREAASQLPQNLQVIAESEALIAGISAAYREAGLPSASRELSAAVLRALTDDTAKSKWHAGTSVFAD